MAMRVRVVITGRNYHALGNTPVELELPEGSSVEAALESVAQRLGQPLPETCLVAVSGAHLGTVRKHLPRELRPGDELLLLVPVAGG